MKGNSFICRVLVLFFVLSCSDSEKKSKPQLMVGISDLNLLPDKFESHEETTGNNSFDGCIDNPKINLKCKESFNDLNGNGKFDALYIGGFGYNRPATGVHDPIKASALMIKKGDDYVVLVGLDLVGLGFHRINQAKEILKKEGLDPEKIIFSSSHNHQGPDVVGIWGDPFAQVSGLNIEFQESLAQKLATVVLQAKKNLKKAKFKISKIKMRDENSYFNGSNFGGKNKHDRMHGLLNDIRDPILVDDGLLSLAFNDENHKRIATFINFSAHPEIVGSKNTKLSADYVYYLRDWIEKKSGGKVVFMPSCLGGMMSALGGDVPLLDEKGTWQYQTCPENKDEKNCKEKALLDSDGEKVPMWAKRNSFEFARSFGFILAQTAEKYLKKAEYSSIENISVKVEPLFIPINNPLYRTLQRFGILDLDEEFLIKGEKCSKDPKTNCIPSTLSHLTLGPWQAVTAPGELLPELYLGVPKDKEEFNLDVKRGKKSKYFPQHDSNCNGIEFKECQDKVKADWEGKSCNCTKIHDNPYKITTDSSLKPVSEYLKAAKFHSIIGAGNDYASYIVPDNDVNSRVSIPEENVGDHYEEAISPSRDFGSTFLKAVKKLMENKGK